MVAEDEAKLAKLVHAFKVKMKKEFTEYAAKNDVAMDEKPLEEEMLLVLSNCMAEMEAVLNFTVEKMDAESVASISTLHETIKLNVPADERINATLYRFTQIVSKDSQCLDPLEVVYTCVLCQLVKESNA